MEIAFFPKLILQRLASNYIQQYQWNILLSNATIIVLFLIFSSNIMNIINSIPHFCLFQKIFGIDCPACGITRGFVEIANGCYSSSLNYNFSSIFIAIFILLQIPLRLFAIIFKKEQSINQISKVITITIIAQLILFWIFKFL